MERGYYLWLFILMNQTLKKGMNELNKKSTFISWVSEHKLRTTNANEFSDALERVLYPIMIWMFGP